MVRVLVVHIGAREWIVRSVECTLWLSCSLLRVLFDILHDSVQFAQNVIVSNFWCRLLLGSGLLLLLLKLLLLIHHHLLLSALLHSQLHLCHHGVHWLLLAHELLSTHRLTHWLSHRLTHHRVNLRHHHWIGSHGVSTWHHWGHLRNRLLLNGGMGGTT